MVTGGRAGASPPSQSTLGLKEQPLRAMRTSIARTSAIGLFIDKDWGKVIFNSCALLIVKTGLLLCLQIQAGE